MRKLFFAATISMAVLFGCNAPGNQPANQVDNSQSEKNLASARAVARAFETGNANSIDTVVAEDYIDHTDRGDKMGRDSLKAMISFMQQHGRNMKMETIREVSDNDYVFQWMRYTGTSDGSMGPAGPYDMKVIEVSKHKNGKIVEHWAYMDASEMMKMMPQPQLQADHIHGDSVKSKQ